MDKKLFEYKLKSHIEIGEIYFYTATINSWRRLLSKDPCKDLIINSLKYLSEAGLIDVLLSQ
jgi:putative transposase